MVWTDPPVVGSGSDLTAANFNTYVIANLKALGDSWTSWTPALSGGSSWSVGNGAAVGGVMQAGKLIAFRAQITFGSTTSIPTGSVSISLPFPTVTGVDWTFGGSLRLGGSVYRLTTAGSGSSVPLLQDPASAGGNLRSVVLSTGALLPSPGDRLNLTGLYEAA